MAPGSDYTNLGSHSFLVSLKPLPSVRHLAGRAWDLVRLWALGILQATGAWPCFEHLPQSTT